MAGDWIKVEQATLHKAEVLRMAELLGIPRRECMGLMLDFWAWLDNNARAEIVPNLSRLSLDSVLNCPGFSGAMELIGWIEWNDKAVSARIVNYDRHNSASAKTRAYEQRKKKLQRESRPDSVPKKQGLEKEKRREEIDNSLRSLSTATKKRPPLDGPTTEHEAIAAERGLSCQTEFQKYRDWQASTGKRHKDEVAGFRNWLRNAKVPAGRKVSAMDILTGRVRDERVIEGERVGGAVVLSLPGGVREPDGDDVEGRGAGRSAASVG